MSMSYAAGYRMRCFLLLAVTGALLASCTYVQVFEIPEGATDAGAEAGEPVVLASGQGKSSGGAYYGQDLAPLDGPDEVATDGAFVYWTNLRGEVMRVPAGGGEVTRVTFVDGPVALAVDDASVFVGSAATRTVLWAPKSGGTATAITSANSEIPMQLALGGDLVFWSSGDGVYACAKAGCSAARALWRSETGAVTGTTSGITFAHERVYFGYTQITGPIQGQGNASGAIMSIGVDGSGNGQVANGFPSYYLLSTDGESVYATADNAIVRAPLQGAVARKVLASGADVNPWRILAVGGYVYWTELFPPGRVMRVKNDGDAPPEAVSPPTTGARGITASSDTIYWTTGDGRVMKLALAARFAPQPR